MRTTRNAYRIRCLLGHRSVALALLLGMVLPVSVMIWTSLATSTHARGLVEGVSGLLLFLSAGCLYLYAAYPYLEKTRVRLGMFCALFIGGYLCYYYMPGDWWTCADQANDNSLNAVLNAYNYVLSTFYPSRGAYEHPAVSGWPILYQLFHLLTLLYVSGVVFSLFGRRFMDNLQWRWVFPEDDLNVFWEVGCNPRSERLAMNLMSSGVRNQIVVRMPREIAGDDEVRQSIRRYTANGVMFDLSESSALSEIGGVSGDDNGVQPSEVRGLRHFFLGEDTMRNLRMATAVLKAMGEQSSAGKLGKIRKLYVRIDSCASERTGAGWADEMHKLYKDIAEIHLIHEASLVARRFVVDNPMLDCPGISIDTEKARAAGAFRVLLIGFDDVARTVLNAMICDAAVPGTSFSADVCCAPSPAVAAYRADFSEVCSNYAVRFLCNEGIVPDDGFAARIPGYNRIVISTGDAALNVIMASMCRRAMTSSGKTSQEVRGCLFVHDERDLTGLSSAEPGCSMFGALGQVYNKEVIIDEKLDAAARELNYAYYLDRGENSNQDQMNVWIGTNFGDQESSRASVLGERNLLRLVGLTLARVGEGGRCVSAEEYEALLRKDGIEIALAEAEHLRWNSHMLTRGVRPWDLVTPSTERAAKLNDGNLRANGSKSFNRHAAIIPFAALPALDLTIARINAEREAGRRNEEAVKKGRPATATAESVAGALDESMFTGEGMGCGFHANMQWNDIKFVRRIPAVAAKVGLGIVYKEK